MIHGRARVVALAAPALTGAETLGVCGGNGSAVTMTFRTPTVAVGSAATGSSATPATTPAAAGPTGGWGSDVWSRAWGSGRGNGHMGSWWVAGNGTRVQTLDQVRQRPTAFADRLALRVGEGMQVSRNFYAGLQSGYGDAATAILVKPADKAVQVECGPAMMWNTDYGMLYGSRSRTRTLVGQVKHIALTWLRARDTEPAPGDPESYPGTYTLRTGKITDMLSVKAATGQVLNHSWYGTYVATSQR